MVRFAAKIPDWPEDELERHLSERLARFKLPKAFRFLDELPRTAYGKVVKGELRKRFEEKS